MSRERACRCISGHGKHPSEVIGRGMQRPLQRYARQSAPMEYPESLYLPEFAENRLQHPLSLPLTYQCPLFFHHLLEGLFGPISLETFELPPCFAPRAAGMQRALGTPRGPLCLVNIEFLVLFIALDHGEHRHSRATVGIASLLIDELALRELLVAVFLPVVLGLSLWTEQVSVLLH